MYLGFGCSYASPELCAVWTGPASNRQPVLLFSAATIPDLPGPLTHPLQGNCTHTYKLSYLSVASFEPRPVLQEWYTSLPPPPTSHLVLGWLHALTSRFFVLWQYTPVWVNHARYIKHTLATISLCCCINFWECPLISSLFLHNIFACIYRSLSSDVQDEWRQCEDCENSSLHARLLWGMYLWQGHIDSWGSIGPCLWCIL